MPGVEVAPARIEATFDRVLEVRRDDLAGAVTLACRQGLECEAEEARLDLAWRVALNLIDRTKGYRSTKVWRDDADEEALWRRITQPRTSGLSSEPYSFLSEQLWSLSCERSTVWRRPGTRVDLARTEEALAHLIDRTGPGLARALRGQHALDAAALETLVQDAWVQVFRSYWAENARSRFLGLCRISSLLVTAARRIQIASRARATDLEPLPTVEPEAPVDRSRETERLWSALLDCIDRLPEKQRDVWCHLMNGRRESEIASDLGIGRPAISNHKIRARPSLEKCLERRGIELPD